MKINKIEISVILLLIFLWILIKIIPYIEKPKYEALDHENVPVALITESDADLYNPEDAKDEATPASSVQEIYDPIDEKWITLEQFNDYTEEMYRHFKGVGEVTAERIFNYRIENGDFISFEALIEVKGIGVKKLEGIITPPMTP